MAKKSLIISLICFAIAIYCALHIGCASVATMAREDGFRTMWRGFDSIPDTPDLYREVEIRIKVRIFGVKMGGTYSHPDGIITLQGKRTPHGIVVCEAVLGHEVFHALQFQSNGFADPDKLKEKGY